MSKGVVSAALVALQFGTVVANDSEKLILTDLDQDRTLQDDEFTCLTKNDKDYVHIDDRWTRFQWTGKGIKKACKKEARELDQNWIFVKATKACYLGETKPHLIRNKYMVDNETGAEAEYGCYNKNSKQVPPFECMASHGKYQLDKSWKWKWIYSTNFETRKAECSKAAEEAGLNWMLSLKMQGVFSGNEYYWICHIGKGHPTIDETNGREAYIGCFNESPKKPICSDDYMKFCDEKLIDKEMNLSDQEWLDCFYGRTCIKQGCFEHFLTKACLD